MKRILLVLFLVFTSYSCCIKETENSSYYYDVFSSEKKVTALIKINSTYHNNERIDTIFRYDLNGRIVDKYEERYIVSKDTLYKINLINNKVFPYLVVDTNYCNFIENGEKIQTCFLEQKTSHLIFSEELLTIDGVEKKLVFDKKFNLVENEYLNGNLSYYKILLRDTPPSILSNPKK